MRRIVLAVVHEIHVNQDTVKGRNKRHIWLTRLFFKHFTHRIREEMIQNAISKLMKGRTAIVIAHRLSTIQNANKIMVLDKGEIKESGTNEELLEKDGWYADLYNMQFLSVM